MYSIVQYIGVNTRVQYRYMYMCLHDHVQDRTNAQAGKASTDYYLVHVPMHVLRPRSSRADELLDLLVDLPKSSSTWALIRRALRLPVNWPESSQAASRPGRRALGPRLAPSELSVWLSGGR
eukprot:COSAG02_NODE_3004_length_7571_cov_65.586188_8_plen_122_part_00